MSIPPIKRSEPFMTIREIKELLEDDDKRKDIAARGRAYTLKNNTWDRRVEDFLKLYGE